MARRQKSVIAPAVQKTTRREPSQKPAADTWPLPPELWPNIDNIQIEDGKPVDGYLTEKQMRLLTEPLYSSWSGPGQGRPFIASADVGVFFTPGDPPLVPDVFLSLDVSQPSDLSKKENLSYFVWLRGKVPDVAIEIVSNREGGEDTSKLHDYARLRVPYYVIYDPLDLLGGGVIRTFELRGNKYHPIPPEWLEDVGLGLTFWTGTFEGVESTWLRWRDKAGNVIPTGVEGREQQRRRADDERKRADQAHQENRRLKAELRERGVAGTPSAKAEPGSKSKNRGRKL